MSRVISKQNGKGITKLLKGSCLEKTKILQGESTRDESISNRINIQNKEVCAVLDAAYIGT